MPDDLLPVDVLTELGRVTWAVIVLEDFVDDLCWYIEPVDRQADKRQISQKIKDAKGVLRTRQSWEKCDQAIAWLERARQAMERRNAALHATPIAWVGRGRDGQLGLAEMPRNGRPYVETPLTVESLRDLRLVLEEAAAGWTDLLVAVSAEFERSGREEL